MAQLIKLIIKKQLSFIFKKLFYKLKVKNYLICILFYLIYIFKNKCK
jgi:hypothetical protein